ncbi:polymorphic toxin type 37 domain-containing protein [Nocardia gipuzkoensis]|uniref:polymorphic toxin type 37 domain-containing protein n=1 Tax=Nocardia gipuzkoensis TaxID=2749991 RepID=UPI0015EF0CA2|nr:polymorphic toxin type 37 domain-containing protein [Nocardia gipuzkoensis]
MAVVAPQSYYTAADACYKLSREFQAAYNPLQTALLETGGMAGSYQAAKAWSVSYDERAGAFTTAATNFARALQHFGDILIASGYNWECANYAANRDPNKGVGPSCPRAIPSELPYGAGVVVGVASSRDNGSGLESEFPELYEKVIAKLAGGEIPDGDTDKLDRAAKAWKAFADDTTIFAAEARLRAVADGLAKFDAPDIQNLTEGPALDSAATSIARVIGTFFTALSGIKFSAAALATTALATITGLTILSIAGDATFNSNYKPPANAYDPNGPKAPGRPGEAEGFVPPKDGDKWVPNPNGKGSGWLDADGRVWVPTGQGSTAHGGPHWDVQEKKGGYTNVYPGGKSR